LLGLWKNIIGFGINGPTGQSSKNWGVNQPFWWASHNESKNNQTREKLSFLIASFNSQNKMVEFI